MRILKRFMLLFALAAAHAAIGSTPLQAKFAWTDCLTLAGDAGRCCLPCVGSCDGCPPDGLAIEVEDREGIVRHTAR